MNSPHATMPQTVRDDDTGLFSAVAWQRTATVREAIDALPLLRQLADATLPEETFTNYLAQDALYLADYGRVLAAAAAQARTTDEMAFWAQSARNVVEVERALHAAHVTDLTAAEPSPTTVAYTSYLLALAASGNYPALAAGILPCFWVYDDVGTRLKATAGDLSAHPYGDWIATYGDPDFTAPPTPPGTSWTDSPPRPTPARGRACTPRSIGPPSTSGCSGTPPTATKPGPSDHCIFVPAVRVDTPATTSHLGVPAQDPASNPADQSREHHRARRIATPSRPCVPLCV